MVAIDADVVAVDDAAAAAVVVVDDAAVAAVVAVVAAAVRSECCSLQEKCRALETYPP